ncbi:MAG: hypothetical protein J7M25_14345 [Deltaproteobacteria bacterium]|nr:hypothetical protein [Deltaproteobacteria bacterium]
MRKQTLILGCAVAFVLSSCLFVGKIEPVDKRPAAVIKIQTEDKVHVGDMVVLDGQDSSDPDGTVASYSWTMEYDVTQQTPYKTCPGWGSCDNGHDQTCCFIPTARTVFTIRLKVQDQRGLSSPWDERVVTVLNRPPNSVLSLETKTNLENHFVVGQQIWLHGLSSSDPDGDDTLFYHWQTISRPPGSSTLAYQFQPSDVDYHPTNDPTLAKRCLMVPDYPGSYEVALGVSDGDDDATDTKHIEVQEDAPPCITATSPDASASRLIFDVGQPRRLEVLLVDDDLDGYPPGGQLSFSWSIQPDPNQPFFPVSGLDEPALNLDPNDYTSGQQVRIRVTVRDRIDRDLSSCSQQSDQCNLVADCAQWVTWNIEFR